MRKYIFLIILSFTLLISLAATFQVENTFPLFGRTIVLDPGHGSLDPGSVSGDEYEKEYNLAFTETLKKELENRGANVVLTRGGDYDLSSPNASSKKRSDFNNRIKLINETKPDIYLSLHMNSISTTTSYGSQVFYSTVNPKNEKLAEILQDELNKYLGLDKEYKKIGSDKYMFSRLEPNGVLIEYGFLSSPKDRENLKTEEYKAELSTVIANTIVDYFT